MKSEVATSWPMANGHSQNLIEALPAAFYLCNASAVIVSYNRRAAELWGRAPAIGDPDEKYCGSYRLYWPDGTFIPHDESPMAWVLRIGKPVADREVVIERPDGSRITALVNIAPLFGDDGELVGAANCFQDITAEKRNDAEKIRLAAELRQAHKMEALGHLTAGMVHDLNNLLTVVLGNLELLRRRTHDDGALTLLSNATLAAKRGATLNGQLLDFAHKRPLLPKSVDLNQVLVGMGGLFQSMIGGMIEIETNPQPDAWPALVDANQIALVILNLAINARDAMPDGGKLTIETRNMTIAASGGPGELPAGDYVALSVRDTGTGMSEEARAKAFEPFFTTKGSGHGSGLGLSMALDVAKQFGGDMQIDSRLGDGTTINLYLPRADDEALSHDREMIRSVAPIDASVAGGQVVLVVDDDSAVREVTAALIASAGYSVIEAPSGPAALAVLERGEPRVDLAIIDISMPDMSGIEAVRRAQQKQPDLPILYLTGHTDLARFGTGDIDRSRIVGKPFSRNDLLTRVHACMAERAGLRPANDAEPGTASDRIGSAAST